jgi:hypothetical protein
LGAIMTNLLYFTISLALVALVGRALSRSGAAFLAEMFADRGGVAEAVNRLLVVAFYLLSCGFIALTMPVWGHVGSAGQALQLLSGKIGELLLVLGALHVASTVVFARLRRAPSWPTQSGPGGFSPRTTGSGSDSSGSDSPGSDSPGSGLSGSGPSGSGRPVGRPGAEPANDRADAHAATRVAAPALWRPRQGHVVH